MNEKNAVMSVPNDVKAVVIDLDGTLYDKRGLAKRLVARLWWCMPVLLAERRARVAFRGCSYPSKEQFYQAFFAQMARGHWWSARIAEWWYRQVYMPTMVQTIRCHCNPRQDVMQLIEECRRRKITMLLYSDYGCAEEKLQALGISPSYFSVIVDAPSMGGLKPAKALAMRVLVMADAHQQTTLFVGDRDETDGASARVVGARFLSVERGVMDLNNARYRELHVTDDTYVPPVTTDYPENDPYQGLYKPVYDHDFPAVDANYPYFDESFRNRMRMFGGYSFILRPLGWILRIKYGLRWRIEGEQDWRRSSCGVRRWLKQFDMSRGAITVANHCYRHDCASVLTTFHASYHTRIPMFAPNFRTKDQIFLCAVGGIPIPAPEEGLSAMKAFNNAFDEYNRLGYWFHIFPEAKRWDWYKPIRPFQKGAFTMAYKYNKPILPFAISYRPRTGIYRLFGSQDEPLTQVTIGAPIFPDTTQPRAAETERLRQLTHETVCRLAGITRNTWPVKPENE